MGRNDRLKTIALILDGVKCNPYKAKTRQFQFTRVNMSICVEVSAFLVSKGYLRIVPNGISNSRFSYRITDEGLLLLKQINWCYDAVTDKPKIGVMQFA